MMKKVPKRRFKGFLNAGDWEQRKLADVANIIMGQSPSSQNYTDNPNDNILVQGNADLIDGQVVPRLWTKEITKSIDAGNIVMTVRAPVGDVAKTAYKVVLGRGVAGIKGDEYIYQFLLKLKYNHYWRSLSSGSTFESINSNDIKNLIIDIPCDEERTKIRNLLSTTDTLITLHQRKLEKLQATKKALLYELFPIENSRRPKRRFKGFTGDWEQRKLGELVTVFSGRDYKHLSEGDIPVYGTGGYMLSVNEALSNDQDAIGIGRKGTIDKPYILKAPFWTVDTLFYAIPKEKMDLNFIFCIFKNVDWRKLDESTGVPSLSKSTITNVDVYCPFFEEQLLIGRFFSWIDSSITLHQRKLEKFKNLKAAYLNEMFV